MRSVSYLPSSLRMLEQQVREALLKHFDSYTSDEWIEQHLRPLDNMVGELERRQKALTSASSWPRRPLPKADPKEDSKGTDADGQEKGKSEQRQ